MSMTDLLLGWRELEQALPEYLEAEAYATGKVDEVFASSGLVAQKLSRASRRYRFNLLSVPIMSRVDRMKINTVKVTNDESATSRIDEIWSANDMDVWYPELIEKTLTFGDAYVMVWPIAQDEEDAELEGASLADEELVAAGVEFTVHDPKNCRILYDPENERRKSFAIRRWQIDLDEDGVAPGTQVWRVDLWYPDVVEHWVSLENAQLDQPEGWTEWLEEDTDGNQVAGPLEPHDAGEIPFFHHRTALPYGRPVHEAGYGAQNALTKMLCTQLDTSDSQGWPQRYRLLDPDAELDQNSDAPEWLDDADATAQSYAGQSHTGGASTQLRQGPGSLQTYPGTKEVGQFDAATPDLFLDPAVVYIKIMATETRTPTYQFWPEETAMGAAPSGEALRRADLPLTSSIQRLQTLQRGAIREEWLFALRQLGVKVKELDIQWQPVEQARSVEDWTVVGLKQQYGVPQEQTLTEAGYTNEQAEEWQAEAERKQAEMMDQMADLAAAEAKGQPKVPERTPPTPGGKP